MTIPTHQTPTPEPPAPPARAPWRRRLALVVATTVLAAGAAGIGTAAAQTDDEPAPSPDETTEAPTADEDGALEDELDAFDACLEGQLGPEPEELDEEALSPADLEAMEAEWDRALDACEQHLSDEERAEMAAWDDFDACLDQSLGGDFWAQEDELFDGEDGLDEAQIDAAIAEMDARFEQAEAACAEALPEDLRAEMEAWKGFDACVDAALESGPVVIVENGVSVDVGAFGDGAGTITVTKAADGEIGVAADGSASIGEEELFDDVWFQEAEGSCEHLAPEDLDA